MMPLERQKKAKKPEITFIDNFDKMQNILCCDYAKYNTVRTIQEFNQNKI